ncbi:MAG TPA: hypothetical protein VL240_03125 [Candidatus Binatia bacterium]|nr:hypothetical protein [Candidatus Binatia bacterium]
MKQREHHFNVTQRANVPTGRKGKHHSIVGAIMTDLDGLEPGFALKIPLDELPDSKVNVRSALNRAAHKAARSLATATDEEFLYVWNT